MPRVSDYLHFFSAGQAFLRLDVKSQERFDLPPQFNKFLVSCSPPYNSNEMGSFGHFSLFELSTCGEFVISVFHNHSFTDESGYELAVSWW